MTAPYILHGAPFSLFTRKLEAALHFYQAPFLHQALTIGASDGPGLRAGTHQIPVLETPEDWMLADTTPILDLLDARFPSHRMFPDGPLGVLVHIVEEVLDEWTARVMVHFRWHYEDNVRHIIGEFLGREVTIEEAERHPLAQWGPRACRATGTESPFHQAAVEREFFAVLAALEQQLGETRYALGERPCAVDTVLLGGLRAHVNNDPLPDLSAYPSCTAWDTHCIEAWAADGALAEFPNSTPFAQHILELARDEYLPFLLGNAAALAAGHKAFTIETYGEPLSYLTRSYPERSRRMVQARIRDRLSNQQRSTVTAWLNEVGLAAAFAP